MQIAFNSHEKSNIKTEQKLKRKMDVGIVNIYKYIFNVHIYRIDHSSIDNEKKERTLKQPLLNIYYPIY